MARSRFKLQFALYVGFLASFVQPLPIRKFSSTTDNVYQLPSNLDTTIENADIIDNGKEIKAPNIEAPSNKTDRNVILQAPTTQNNIRPGQGVNRYTVSLTRNGGTVNARAIIDVRLTDETMENPIRLNTFQLNIQTVQVGILTDANTQDAPFTNIDNILDVRPRTGPASTYVLVVEYNFPLGADGMGLFGGGPENNDYIAMNLHPTNARRVFPCMDEPNLSSITSFTFNNMGFNNLISNSLLEVDSTTTFRALEGPAHLWGMVAHNFPNINIPVVNTVFLYARQGAIRQDGQAAVAISNYYHAFNTWTEKDFTTIILNQNGGMHITALPDIEKDWYALSTVCIWEPYILMENINAVNQRKLALVAIAEAMAKQWFGYVLHPQNWRFQWVISGLGSYAAYEVVKAFQTSATGEEDETLIDMNTVFTTDVIQESLLYDAYGSAQPLELPDNIFNENQIRAHLFGLLRLKAPAMLRMLSLVLSSERDIVQAAAIALFRSRSLQAINTRNFFDALNSEYSFGDGASELIETVEEFLEPWIENTGYPFVQVNLNQAGVMLTQERFGFSPLPQINYLIPISFTTSVEPNFDEVHPTIMMEASHPLTLSLGDEDWFICNIQGQGYYRVNYDDRLWERIINALSDPESREQIHPLNRATLLDDALNLARAGRIGYEIAFEVTLTMEHELDYAVWKAFVRNMDFVKKRLLALIETNDDRDPDIYLRMIRRSIVAVEEEIGFQPETVAAEPSMTSLTRGLVMDHACRAGYEPCVAAAVDWFYDPNNDEEVNPNIPRDIRPAVYCTMVREGEEDVIEALERRLELEPTGYERLVILESLACSTDNDYIRTLLGNTILAANNPYFTEERLKIFAAVASSSFENSGLALEFLIQRTAAIRNLYGGPEKLDEVIFIMAENIVTDNQADDFTRWVNSLNAISNLGDSNEVAGRARERITQNMAWVNDRMEDAYEWINENDAPTIFVSIFLICISLFITMFN